jgi:hypothetical protein
MTATRTIQRRIERGRRIDGRDSIGFITAVTNVSGVPLTTVDARVLPCLALDFIARQGMAIGDHGDN